MKTIKKITSIGVASAVALGAFTGVLAADLKDYPAPFVSNGVADVQLVVGSTAQAADYLGIVDLATSLQASAVKTEAVAIPGKTSVSVEGGVNVATSSNALLLNEHLASSQTVLDKNDLNVLLADGTLEDESSNDDYDYKQTITLSSDPVVKFGESSIDSDLDEPTLVLDLDAGSDVLWTYEIDFTGSTVDFVALDDSESFEMAGKAFTVSPSVTINGELKLFGSDVTSVLNLNEPKTFTVEGKSYVVSVVGGNSDNDNVIIAVNGQQKTVQEGETVTINGLEVYVKDAFITNIPTLSVAATVFVGSQEIVLPAAVPSPTWTDVEINGDTINGLQALVTASSAATNNSGIDKIQFRMKAPDLNGDVAGFDEKNFLLAGEKISDPLFGTFEVRFDGASAPLMDESSKTMFKIEGGSDDVYVTFTNDDGDEIKFAPFKLTTLNEVRFTKLTDGKGWNGVYAQADNNITDDVIFALNEGSSPTSTQLFEVTGFAVSNGEQVVRIKNLGSGQTDEYGLNDKVVDGVTVDAITGTTFGLSANTVDQLYLKGGENYLDLSGGASTNVQWNITYMEADLDEVSTGALFNFTLSHDANDDETNVGVTVGNGATVLSGDQDNGDVREYLSQYGTYVVEDIDEQSSVSVYTPMAEEYEVHYNVFFAPLGAAVSTSGDSNSVSTQKVNAIAVGAAVLDRDVNAVSPAKNLIVVGGPCVNSVAKSLLKVTDDAKCADGFAPNSARVELFTVGNKVAMLVAGLEAADTVAASRAVAAKDSRMMGTSAVLTIANDKVTEVKSN
jgi:hypothetical protein